MPESIAIGVSMIGGGTISFVPRVHVEHPRKAVERGRHEEGGAWPAGAILAMLADTMIPEAFEAAHDYAGLITVGGFLVAFVLSKLG